MTLKKLAQLANVSLAVVSKAFSGRDDVSDAMREHVFSVAREHGCFQKFYHARYDKPVVAVIIPEAISKYYIRYIETLKRDIEENGYTMLLSISNFDQLMTEELVRYYTEHSKVDGLIIIDGRSNPSKDSYTAIVSANPLAQADVGATISFRHASGTKQCLEYLYSLGHRRIAYVGEELTNYKRKCLLNEAKALGIELCDSHMYTSRLRFEDAGRDGVKKLFSGKTEAPTAIIGAYGYITQGVIAELCDMGLRIPEDVSVISMDNDPYPVHTSLDVACIPSGIDEICEQAMKYLHERIGTDNPNAPCLCTINSTFHVGNTVADIRS